MDDGEVMGDRGSEREMESGDDGTEGEWYNNNNNNAVRQNDDDCTGVLLRRCFYGGD